MILKWNPLEDFKNNLHGVILIQPLFVFFVIRKQLDLVEMSFLSNFSDLGSRSPKTYHSMYANDKIRKLCTTLVCQHFQHVQPLLQMKIYVHLHTYKEVTENFHQTEAVPSNVNVWYMNAARWKLKSTVYLLFQMHFYFSLTGMSHFDPL